MDNLKKMTYVTAVMNETARIYGPGIGLFTRDVAKDTTLGTVPIKKGTLINHEFTTNNHNPAYYDNPSEFRPERWLDTDRLPKHPYAFTPFSLGVRNCLGQYMSVVTTKITLIRLFKRYNWDVDHP